MKTERLFHFTAFYVLTHGHCVCNEARKLQYIITLQLWKKFFVFSNQFFFSRQKFTFYSYQRYLARMQTVLQMLL